MECQRAVCLTAVALLECIVDNSPLELNTITSGLDGTFTLNASENIYFCTVVLLIVLLENRTVRTVDVLQKKKMINDVCENVETDGE